MQGQTVSYTPGVNSHTATYLTKVKKCRPFTESKDTGLLHLLWKHKLLRAFFLQTLTSVKLKDSIVQLALAYTRNAAGAAQQLC